MDFVIGLAPPIFRGPCHLIQRSSKFTRKVARSSLGGGVYSFSEMIDHAAWPREFYVLSTNLSPSMAGLEDCGSLFTRVVTQRTVAEGYLVRRSLGIQRASGNRELDNMYWLPGSETSADGHTTAKSDMASLWRLPQSGSF